MPSGPSIEINPTLLSWAREESGYDVERVAKRLQVKEERVQAWERGERNPTVRQIQLLARFFHRPLGVFFMPKPPPVPPLAAVYRHLPGIEPGHESPELRLALRQMMTRRETALNLFGELGEDVPELRLSARLNESPEAVGNRLREATGVTADVHAEWGDAWEAWREWRAAMENLGVLVFQFPKVPLTAARGLSLLRMPMPVAAINSKEIPEAKIFTLFHEVVHLMLARGKEEEPAARERRNPDEWMDVERFAEQVAAHALIPAPHLENALDELKLAGVEWDIDNVRRVARRFKVSPLAMATRLREAELMTWGQYHAWRAQWEAYTKRLKPRKPGFAKPHQVAVSRGGRMFSQLVLEALDTGRITSVDAARYLELKYEHFGKLRDYVAYGAGGAEPDE